MGEERIKSKLLNVHISPFVSTSPVFFVLSNKLIWALRLIRHFPLWDFSPLHSTWNPLASLPHLISSVFSFKTPFIYCVPWERFLRSRSPGWPQPFLRLHQYPNLFLSLHFYMGLFLTCGYCSHLTVNSLRTGSYVIFFWTPSSEHYSLTSRGHQICLCPMKEGRQAAIDFLCSWEASSQRQHQPGKLNKRF